MKKTLLIIAASLAVSVPALAHPCRGYYRYDRRPCEVHHYYHRSHTWHGSDWGKFAAGAAFGWLANEATTPRQAVVYSPAPVYAAPQVVYTPPPVIQQTTIVNPAPVVRQPVVETITTTPTSTIITRRPTPVVTAPPVVSVIQPETIIRTDNSSTIIRQISY